MPGTSTATRSDLAPKPAKPSAKVRSCSRGRYARYASIDRSRFSFAAGLKNAGTFGGTLSVSDCGGTKNLVCPSTICVNPSTLEAAKTPYLL